MFDGISVLSSSNDAYPQSINDCSIAFLVMSWASIGEGTINPAARVGLDISSISMCRFLSLFFKKSSIAADELYPSPAQMSRIAMSSP